MARTISCDRCRRLWTADNHVESVKLSATNIMLRDGSPTSIATRDLCALCITDVLTVFNSTT